MGKRAPLACSISLKSVLSPAMLPRAHNACSCRTGLGAERKLMSCGAAPKMCSVCRVWLLAMLVRHLGHVLMKGGYR